MPNPQTDGADSSAGVPRARIAGYPTSDPARGRPEQCQLNCIAWGPQGVYERASGGRVIVARPLACTVGDISCSFQCPLEAISFPSKRDLRQMLQRARGAGGEPDHSRS